MKSIASTSSEATQVEASSESIVPTSQPIPRPHSSPKLIAAKGADDIANSMATMNVKMDYLTDLVKSLAEGQNEQK
jgi:hypothetical protein